MRQWLKKQGLRRQVMAAVVGGLTGLAVAGAAAQTPETLIIETAGGEVSFEVELAETAQEQALGLMHRRDLAADAGMLFVHGEDREASMWMKNTLIPLDMLFIWSNGRIESIARRTVPGSLEIIRSGGPVRAVLEIGGGVAAARGIEPGDVVRHRIFGNTDDETQ